MLEVIYIIFMMFLLFGITIFVHEFGHFIVARLLGLVAETFSIGMGPALWKKKVGGTLYKIGAFPIGGYVALPQLDPEGMDKMQGDTESDKEALPEVAPWKKIAVAVAGPLLNVVLAFIIAIAVSTAKEPENIALIGAVAEQTEAFEKGLVAGDQVIAVNGKPVESWYDVRVESLLAYGGSNTVTLTLLSGEAQKEVAVQVNDPKESAVLIDGVIESVPCVLGKTVPESPAERAGVQPGDQVRELNGIRILGWKHFTDELQNYPNQEIPMVVERDGEKITLTITPEYDEGKERVLIGVQFGGSGAMPWALSGSPLSQIKKDAASIFRLLGALTSTKEGEAKQAASGLGGPLAIFTMIWYSLKQGILPALGLIRFLNINLAVLNLLPIPVLDGGHICFALWEMITRRKVHPKVVGILVNTFAFLLIGAMLFLTVRDAETNWKISRLFKKSPPAVEQQAPPAEEAP